MSIVVPEIVNAGKPLNTAYRLLSIDVIKEVNRIARAQLIIAAGSDVLEPFGVSEDDFFEPGSDIEIKLRYGDKAETTASVFKGLVVGLGIEAGVRGALLTVELKDAAVKMTQVRKSAVFRDQTDADIIRTLAGKQSVSVDAIDDTEPQHRELIQYYSSDWDFLMLRAEAQGLLVVTDDGKLSAQRVDLSGSALQRYEYGSSDIQGFAFETDIENQRGNVFALGWNIAEQQPGPSAQADDFEIVQGNWQASHLAGALGWSNETLVDPVPLPPAELKAWANARLVRSRMALLRGSMTVPGNADIKPMTLIEIAGLGRRFSGKALVTGVRHRIDVLQWSTDIQFGLARDSFARRPDIADPAAAGQVPPVQGLRIGVVAAFEDDPDGELRVKTMLPGLDSERDETVWARLAVPDAGNKRGYFFRPEAGDEVVVGFFNDDPRQAVIIGALYSSANPPPDDFAELTENNINKGLVTKSGTKILLSDDEKSKLLIVTPADNKIVLDDDAQAIELSDPHGNSIVMNQDGIVIKSAKNLTIEAAADIEISGKQVDVK
ncbi:MAG: type VI secretion system tip protein VgrG [Gammaproteobacteria bacterium]